MVEKYKQFTLIILDSRFGWNKISYIKCISQKDV